MEKADGAVFRALLLFVMVMMTSVRVLMALLMLMRRMNPIKTEHSRQQQHERDQNSEARFAQQPVDAA